jgi:hypothetical protein
VVVAAIAEADKRFPGQIPVPHSLATGISFVQNTRYLVGCQLIS